MFVPTHVKKRKNREKVELKLLSSSESYDKSIDGVFVDDAGDIWHEALSIVTILLITCPYCKAKVQQDERVECKCGWIAEAITEDVVNSEGLRMCQYMIKVNDIYWLTIQCSRLDPFAN